MPEDILYLGGDNAGALRAIREVVAEKRRLRGELVQSRKASKGLTAELSKIPRRMIVAGGAALGLSAILGTIRGVFQSWNQALDETGQRILTMHEQLGDYLGMVQQASGPSAAVEAHEDLLRQALKTIATEKQLATVKGAYESILTPERGYRREAWQPAVMPAIYAKRLRGEGVDLRAFATAAAKLEYVMKPGLLPAQRGLFELMRTAGFTGEQVGEFMQHMQKAYGGAELVKADTPTVLAMLSILSSIAGTPGTAGTGVQKIMEKTLKKDFPRKIGIPAKVWQQMPWSQRMGAIAESPFGPEWFLEAFGQKVGARAAGLFAGKRAEELRQTEELFERVMAGKEPSIEEMYWARMEADPRFRRAEQLTYAKQIPEMEKEHPRLGTYALWKERRKALTGLMYPYGEGYWKRWPARRWSSVAWPLARGVQERPEAELVNYLELMAGMTEGPGAGRPFGWDRIWELWQQTGLTREGPSPSPEAVMGISEEEQRAPKQGEMGDRVILYEEENP